MSAGRVFWRDCIWRDREPVCVSEQKWAVEGRHNDDTDDLTILINPAHYRVWLWDRCMNADGTKKFNTNFIGRWRNPVVFDTDTEKLRARANGEALEEPAPEGGS